MSRERRRKNPLVDLVVGDPYRKLVAVGLAVMLWFFIDSRIMDSVEYTLPLTVVDLTESARGDNNELAVALPTERVVKRRFLDGDREIQSVRVILSGPRFRIDALKEERLNLAVMTFAQREWQRRRDGQESASTDIEVVEFTADDIRRDVRVLEEIDIAMDPPRVRMEVGIQDNMEITVTNELVQFVGTDLDARLRRETSLYTPRRVLIYGPAISIQKLRGRVPMFRVELEEDGTQAVGQLKIIDADQLNLYFKQAASVRMDLVATREEFTFELPVVVDDLSLAPGDRGRFEIDTKRIPVRVSFSGNMLFSVGSFEDAARRQQWAEQNLRLVVHLQRPEDGSSYGETLERDFYLVPVGPLLERTERSEYKLETRFTVTLRRKNP